MGVEPFVYNTKVAGLYEIEMKRKFGNWEIEVKGKR
jgi:hypothetical protein